MACGGIEIRDASGAVECETNDTCGCHGTMETISQSCKDIVVRGSRSLSDITDMLTAAFDREILYTSMLETGQGC